MNHSQNNSAETPNIGIKGTLPAFSEQLKSRLTFPLSWISGNFPNFEKWREAARAKVWEHILPLPEHRTPFNPETISQQDRGAFFARKIMYNLTEFSRVPALMLIPKGRGPFPAVLLLHDHGSKFDIGKEKVIEPWDDRIKLESAQAWSKQLYGGSFIGNELTERGYCVLAHDALGWGERGVLSYETQQALACNLLNLGVSLAGLTAYEDIRSAEFLASLPEVDSARIAAVGLSMGAFRAWQTAALSDAVKAGIAVCWMTTLKGVLVPGNNILRGQSAFYMTHPGLARYLDYPDVAGIAAPKPLLFYNGGKDALFPLDSVQEAYQKMSRIWGSQQADGCLETKIWPDLGHEFNREQQTEAFQWLDDRLKPKSRP